MPSSGHTETSEKWLTTANVIGYTYVLKVVVHSVPYQPLAHIINTLYIRSRHLLLLQKISESFCNNVRNYVLRYVCINPINLLLCIRMYIIIGFQCLHVGTYAVNAVLLHIMIGPLHVCMSATETSHMWAMGWNAMTVSSIVASEQPITAYVGSEEWCTDGRGSLNQISYKGLLKAEGNTIQCTTCTSSVPTG